jgi:acetylornithine/N-succinyldiaminopimelate aminotransferase
VKIEIIKFTTTNYAIMNPTPLSLMSTEDLFSIDQEHHLPTFRRFPLAIKEGKGSRVWDFEGKEYIDGLAGIAVNAVGHAHPYWVQAIADQAGKVAHVSNLHLNEPQMLLAKKLAELSGLKYSFFCNSGAEAVEGAMKIARKYAQSVGRGGTIMTMQQAFHGRTMATVAASGKKSMMVGFEPIPTGPQTIWLS